jgi:hypothetical protein
MCSYGSRQDKALNNLADETRQQGDEAQSTGDRKKQGRGECV